MHTHFVKLLADVRNSLGGLGGVDRDAHQLGAGQSQFFHLNSGANRVACIGIGHGLHPHGCVAPHRDHMVAPAHLRLQTFVAGGDRKGNGLFSRRHSLILPHQA